MAGNPMSNGGYQFSHMHQSLDQEEMEPMYDDLVENNILIKDGIQMDEMH